ncbi:hypothetical protein SAMN06295937_100795 [Sphingopyxis flava]|uniref:Uncharacterized protein n=1 Tax=Sphingopyxis flava TaxID=1507287 RepID=A0A1T5BS58_9SPHN|nr:hypothetical protein SAMN06295937_100795 [Sphingopyxis flava]
MAKSEVRLTTEDGGRLVLGILWEALRNNNYPKATKEQLLGTIRSIEADHGLEPRRYNHGQ